MIVLLLLLLVNPEGEVRVQDMELVITILVRYCLSLVVLKAMLPMVPATKVHVADLTIASNLLS